MNMSNSDREFAEQFPDEMWTQAETKTGYHKPCHEIPCPPVTEIRQQDVELIDVNKVQ